MNAINVIPALIRKVRATDIYPFILNVGVRNVIIRVLEQVK